MTYRDRGLLSTALYCEREGKQKSKHNSQGSRTSCRKPEILTIKLSLRAPATNLCIARTLEPGRGSYQPGTALSNPKSACQLQHRQPPAHKQLLGSPRRFLEGSLHGTGRGDLRGQHREHSWQARGIAAAPWTARCALPCLPAPSKSCPSFQRHATLPEEQDQGPPGPP